MTISKKLLTISAIVLLFGPLFFAEAKHKSSKSAKSKKIVQVNKSSKVAQVNQPANRGSR